MHLSVRLAVPALLIAGFSIPAFAQDANVAAPAAVENVVKPVKEKRVCRRDTDTGSNIPHSICHTKAEWVAIDAQDHVSTANALRDAHFGNH